MRDVFSKVMLIAIAIILFSCSRGKDETNFCDFPKEESLIPTMRVNLTGLIQPSKIIVSDSLLFVYDRGDESAFLKIYCKKDFHLIKSFGEVGRGPNEFINPVLAFASVPLNSIWLLDVAGSKFYQIDLSELIHKSDLSLKDYSLDYKDFSQLFNSFIPIANGKYYSTGTLNYGRFVTWDSALNIVNLGGEPLKDYGLQEPIRSIFYLNHLCFDSLTNTLYCALARRDRIFKFDINTKVLLDKFSKNYKEKQPVFIGGNNLEQDYLAFAGLKLWRNKLFAPYFGGNFIEINDNNYKIYYPHDVLVFDSNLRPLTVLHFDIDIQGMEIDANGLMYVLTSDIENPIYIYNLKKHIE
ncbi:hypothetical protein [Tenuifilum sp.]|uniref:hypothetical protein n=1 Tax=Tenuifilum sp. TaxID=2760880 RepID=UPI002B6BE211|nr:hypothetical protein [Tenuifilum sp.]